MTIPICPTCHTVIPDKKLTCLPCAQKKFDEALLENQLPGLPAVIAGKTDFKTVEMKRGICHIVMFGYEMTWCKQTFGKTQRRGWIAWDKLDDPKICAQCRIEVRSAARLVSA